VLFCKAPDPIIIRVNRVSAVCFCDSYYLSIKTYLRPSFSVRLPSNLPPTHLVNTFSAHGRQFDRRLQIKIAPSEKRAFLDLADLLWSGCICVYQEFTKRRLRHKDG